MTETIRRSVNALYLLVFFVIIGVTLFSSAMHLAERGEYNEELGFYTRPIADEKVHDDGTIEI